MAGKLFNRGALRLLDGTIVWGTGTFKARLSRTSETLDQDATSMTGIGLSATDISLGTFSGPTEDQANDRITFDAADLVFPTVASGAEVDKVVFFKFGTNDADSIPIGWATMAAAQTPNGGDINAALDSVGLFYSQQ